MLWGAEVAVVVGDHSVAKGFVVQMRRVPDDGDCLALADGSRGLHGDA